MAATKLFLVTKQDTVITMTGYLVRAHDAADALSSVDAGMYIEETTTETIDTIESITASVEEIDPDAKGQERNESRIHGHAATVQSLERRRDSTASGISRDYTGSPE